ncbi:RNA polymerase sigma factor [Limibaculum sp. FT325]|uniref:RNA polymerase sigma factor n=1 Tax=Thermohalobaculum sediminis TaxID=2939436 RepID=UPI0020BDA4C9|nr:RNA polymerase sigma factor [Limibaculum sediminis]MCL5776913.1 RNA polymerase sigma factor [Limibaculum sediminis]
MQDELRTEIAALVPRLRRFARALSGSAELGDDIVQTACVKALSRLDQFAPGTRLDSWMFRIARNAFLDHLRLSRSRGERAADDVLEAWSDGGLGARRAEDSLTLAAVRREMAALPEDQRAVLALVAIEGLSYREVAEITGVPIGTVMSRLARARRRLLQLSDEVSA